MEENKLTVEVGGKIKFINDRCKYTVQVRNERFIICTRKFMKTVMYTIIDLKKQIRGTDNLVFGMGYESKEDCEDNLRRLVEEDMEISHRNRISLDVEEIFHVVDQNKFNEQAIELMKERRLKYVHELLGRSELNNNEQWMFDHYWDNPQYDLLKDTNGKLHVHKKEK